MRHLPCLLITLLAAAGAAQAQPPLPQPMPAPLMYLRFAGPKDAKITIYRGSGASQVLELPCTVGFRPGYSYRIAVSDMAAFPRQVFCPSIEVRGALGLIPKLRNADFPAQITFSEDDFHKALGGTLIKKVVILERPDQAIPVASQPDAPLEVPVAALRDPLIEGAQQGLPLVIVQLGQRFFSPHELNGSAVPGTVLLPGEHILGMPSVAPWLGWNWCPVCDPLLGPRNPSEFMTLYDGGDSGPLAGVSRNGKVRGLDATDTVAEYTNRFGEKRLAVSNRVALCIPRFVIYKGEIAASTQIGRQNVNNAHTLKTPSASIGQLSMKEQTQQQHAEGVDTKLRASGTYNSSTTSAFGRVLGLEVKSTLRNSAGVEAVKVSAPPEAADGPLRIIKWPDKCGALVGDTVTFYLKYTNSGGQPITNVVVSDSLTARFEYVKGSTKTDRDALFTIQPNEVGSAVLRWEFTGALQAHEHGVISFQVRVR